MLVTLSRGQVALVDYEDAERVLAIKWHAVPRRFTHGFYARTAKGLMLHHFILGRVAGKMIDHINGDSLDNRRCNLRHADAADNARNCSRPMPHGYRGILFRAGMPKPWRARICVNYKKVDLGHFSSAIEAAKAYDAAARKHFGAFATLNFPDEGEVAARDIHDERRASHIMYSRTAA